MTVSERINSFLRETGWGKAEFADRAGISQSTVTRLLHGRKTRDGGTEEYELGELVAMKIERATYDAWTRGEIKALPLRAADLLALQERPSAPATQRSPRSASAGRGL